MRKNYLILIVGALLVVNAAWFGRAAWRIQKQLVSLDVYNMPLTDVLRKIERQTWKNIRAEANLDARISLHVFNMSLSNVLDRIAAQAGARWSTVYAVYDSRHALNALESALGADGNIEGAGWKKIAPADGPDIEGKGPMFRAGPPPDGDQPKGGAPRMMMFMQMPNGETVAQNGTGQMEVWSPEELVIESALAGRASEQESQKPIPVAAAEAAKKAKSKWASYIAFRKSMMGVGFSQPPRKPTGLDLPRHNPHDRFAKLTPAQRVQQARRRQGINPE